MVAPRYMYRMNPTGGARMSMTSQVTKTLGSYLSRNISTRSAAMSKITMMETISESVTV